MSTNADEELTVGQAAERLGCQSWRLARLYRRGLLPEPRRVGNFRVVLASELPAIAEALRKAGYLK